MAASDPKGWSEGLHDARGSGSGSRSRLDIVKLEDAGWKIISRQSGNRVHFTYIDPDGAKFKSGKDVERKLDVDGSLAAFLKSENVEKAVTITERVEAVEEDSDEDYEPLLQQRAKQDLDQLG